jgi:hypothetical protein
MAATSALKSDVSVSSSAVVVVVVAVDPSLDSLALEHALAPATKSASIKNNILEFIPLPFYSEKLSVEDNFCSDCKLLQYLGPKAASCFFL